MFISFKTNKDANVPFYVLQNDGIWSTLETSTLIRLMFVKITTFLSISVILQ